MNEAKLHEFMGKVVTDMGGAWMMAMVLIGDELGLYKAMADGKPVTAEALATRCGCIRVWCANGSMPTPPRGTSRSPMAPTDCRRSKRWPSPTKTRRSSWRLDRASSLRASWISTRSLQAFGAMARSLGRASPPDVPRRGAVLPPWLPGESHDGLAARPRRSGRQAQAGRQGGRRRMRPWRVHHRHGKGLSELAVRGYRLPQALGRDRGQARRRGGLGARVTSPRRRRRAYTERDFDLVCFFDCLHDMGDPVGAARHARQALKDDGTVSRWSHSRATISRENSTPVGGCTTQRRPWSARRTPFRRRSVSRSGPRPAKHGSRGYSRRQASHVPAGNRDTVQPDPRSEEVGCCSTGRRRADVLAPTGSCGQTAAA